MKEESLNIWLTTSKRRWYIPSIYPEIPRNTQKCPEVKRYPKIPDRIFQHSYPTRYPVFFQYPTQPNIEKPYTLGTGGNPNLDFMLFNWATITVLKPTFPVSYSSSSYSPSQSSSTKWMSPLVKRTLLRWRVFQSALLFFLSSSPTSRYWGREFKSEPKMDYTWNFACHSFNATIFN